MSKTPVLGEMEGADQPQHPPQELVEGDEVKPELEGQLLKQLLADPAGDKDCTGHPASQPLLEQAATASATSIELSDMQDPQVGSAQIVW